MVMDKRGFLKIVEATVAVIIILVALVFLSAQRDIPERRDIGREVPPLMDELARNLTFREKIAEREDEEVLENQLKLALEAKIKNPAFEISVKICNLTEVCFLEPYPNTEQDIYSSERVISGSIKNESVEPKKVKVFMWRKEI